MLAYCFGYCGVVLDCCVGFDVGFDSNCGFFVSGFGCVVVLRCFFRFRIVGLWLWCALIYLSWVAVG